MTNRRSITAEQPVVWVAVDVAKAMHQVLVETPDGLHHRLRVPNTRAAIEALIGRLQQCSSACEIAFEPTGDYHRPLAYWLDRLDSDSIWSRPSPSHAPAKRAITRGTRTTRRMRR